MLSETYYEIEYKPYTNGAWLPWNNYRYFNINKYEGKQLAFAMVKELQGYWKQNALPVYDMRVVKVTVLKEEEIET